MTYFRPKALKPGDTIGIIAPSSYIEADRLDAGVAILRDLGFGVSIHPQTLARDGQSAGTAVEKVAAFHETVLDPSIRAIMAAGGGNRGAQILPLLDYDLIQSHPKLYIGFSDSTAILAGLAAKLGLISCHGPVVKTLPTLDHAALQTFSGLLTGKMPPYPMTGAKTINPGQAEGRLFGGTLSVLCALQGTGYLPDLTGAILYLEDTGEELSRLDRMLWQLKTAAPFSKLAGIMFGQIGLPPETGRPFGFTLDAILEEHTKGLNIPVVAGAPFGHVERSFPLPFGGLASLSASQDEIKLRLSEPLVG